MLGPSNVIHSVGFRLVVGLSPGVCLLGMGMRFGNLHAVENHWILKVVLGNSVSDSPWLLPICNRAQRIWKGDKLWSNDEVHGWHHCRLLGHSPSGVLILRPGTWPNHRVIYEHSLHRPSGRRAEAQRSGPWRSHLVCLECPLNHWSSIIHWWVMLNPEAGGNSS